MIIVIAVDPATGRCSMMAEGGDQVFIRKALQAMCDDMDQKMNNGQAPPRPSGLVIPNGVLPPDPPPAAGLLGAN